MHWIKVYSKHYLGTNLSLLETGAMIKIQLLTAHLERIPTDKELYREVSEPTCRSLADKLEDQSTTLAEVLHKVCEDVAKVLHKKSEDTARKQKQRKEAKNDGMSGVTPPLIDKSREDKKDKRREDSGNKFTPPSLEVVIKYIKEKGYKHVDSDRFVSYYESNGWMVGKNKMKDWKASLRGWESREKEEKGDSIEDWGRVKRIKRED